METFTPHTKGILLDRRSDEVSRARRAIRSNLSGCTQSTIDLVEQCASETVTNAIVHSESKDNSGTIMLVIVELPDRIRIEVIDDGAADSAPEIPESGDGMESGRGLFIVNALSDAWGSYVDESGRNVWFEVNIY